MIHYYVALNPKGEQCSGCVSAANEAEAIQKLRSQGLYPTRIGSSPVSATSAPDPQPQGNAWSGLVKLAVLCLIIIGFIAFFIQVLTREGQSRDVRRPVEAESQTIIIEGRKYTITITPQE